MCVCLHDGVYICLCVFEFADVIKSNQHTEHITFKFILPQPHLASFQYR